MLQQLCGQAVEIDWQALATFSTGFFAVIAAAYVGLRQLRIEETSLRVAMLERRSKCITEMREIHAEWLRDDRLSQETWSRFREVFWESELTFSKLLSNEIEETLGALFWKDR